MARHRRPEGRRAQPVTQDRGAHDAGLRPGLRLGAPSRWPRARHGVPTWPPARRPPPLGDSPRPRERQPLGSALQRVQPARGRRGGHEAVDSELLKPMMSDSAALSSPRISIPQTPPGIPSSPIRNPPSPRPCRFSRRVGS